MKRSLPVFLASVQWLACAALPGATVDFQRDIRLRFDTREGAFRVKNGRTVIEARKSASSELHRRITHADPEKRMSPPAPNRTLSPREIELLGRWIDEGASWGPAFKAERTFALELGVKF